MDEVSPRRPPEGFEPLGGTTEGSRCARCGGYVWLDERSVGLHRAWHEELERRTRPLMSTALENWTVSAFEE
jgi:hypothetical protein